MADWYVSSVNYAAVAAFAVNTAYTVGQLIKPLTPPAGTAWVFRCTTAGTTAATEPTWTGATANNSTVTSGGATFTNVSGQSAYGWSAACGSLYGITSNYSGRALIGDRIFVGSDHTETRTDFVNYQFGSVAYGGNIQILSVNRAGSVPPVAADLLAGATIVNSSGNPVIVDGLTPLYVYGMTFQMSGTSDIRLGSGHNKTQYFRDCAFKITGTTTTSRITSLVNAKIVFDNTTVQFGHTSQAFGGSTGGAGIDLTWINTPSAIQGATIPATLFLTAAGGYDMFVVCRGVDLSAITGTLLFANTVTWQGKALFDSCKIAAGVTRYNAISGGASAGAVEEVELINCWDGTNVINERYTTAGSVITDRNTFMSSGAQDDVGNYSLKMVSTPRSDIAALSFDCFAFDVENILTGAAKTATVELVAAGLLNNNDIRLLLEYMGTSGNPIASFGDSLASVLTTATALSSSTAVWNSFPATIFDGVPYANVALSGGNLTVTHGSTSNGAGVSSMTAISNGKYYFEFTVSNWSGTGSNANGVGVGAQYSGTFTESAGSFPNGVGVLLGSSGSSLIYAQGVNTTKNLGSVTTGDVIGAAIDLGAKLAWFRRGSGNWNADAAANPATGVGGVAYTTSLIAPYVRFTNGPATDQLTGNFGQSSFANAAPSGFSGGWGVATSQKLQVTFTPQRAGRVRGLVRLGRQNATLWVNPQMRVA